MPKRFPNLEQYLLQPPVLSALLAKQGVTGLNQRCRGTHSYIDAVLQILDARNLKPSDVEASKVVVSPVNKMLCEPLERKQNPVKAIDAQFSLRFVIATALLYGRVTLDHFTPQALVDQDVLEVARKATYEIDTGLTLKEAECRP